MNNAVGAKPRLNQSRADVVRRFFDGIAFNKALAIVCGELKSGRATMTLPYRDELVGDPATGVLHGGVITSLLDACCGAAVFMGIPHLRPIATLDLRIDYFRPAEAQSDVIARAHCHRVTPHVAFVRCDAIQAVDGRTIAEATGAFAIGQGEARG